VEAVLSGVVHAAHAVLAGVWLGGVVFTTAVVSPALKAMKWSEPERVLVRSEIGKRYAKVGTFNLVLLALFAVLDGLLAGFGAVLYAEYLLLAGLFGLVAVHGAYFGRRLKELAAAERSAASEEEARALSEPRRDLQRASLRISVANLLVSLAVALLAAGI
jgi:uncharacterized membrane protein